MKKLALISGLLFLVVYFCVNTFVKEDDLLDAVYPSIPESTLTNPDNPATPVPAEIPGTELREKPVKESYLIVASFTDLEQANKMAEDYSGSHQVEMVVLPPTSKGYYRISYGRYSSAGEAMAVLETIKQTEFPDAWLLYSK
jgi:hypothetical protein